MYLRLLPYFNPRPPRGERPLAAAAAEQHTQFQSTPSARRATSLRETTTALMQRFQSTPSVGRATNIWAAAGTTSTYFNPRPPRGGRRHGQAAAARHLNISIHALREEGDRLCIIRHTIYDLFQSTPSARRATKAQFASGWSASKFQSTPSARRATAKAAKKSATFVPLYTLVHNLKRNFTKAPAKCKTNRAKVSVFAVRSARGNHGSLCLARRGC